MKNIVRAAGWGLVCLMISACSSWFAKAKSMVQKDQPKKEARQMAAPVKYPREPGSIWSEGSTWNVLYSPPMQRQVGDVLLLRPTDAFKTEVAARAGTNLAAEAGQGGNQNGHILAVIREVLPRGIYRVEAKQPFKVGFRDHDIELEGKIREYDLAVDDSTTTDSVLELSMKVKGEEQVAARAAAEANRQLASTAGAKKNPDRTLASKPPSEEEKPQ